MVGYTEQGLSAAAQLKIPAGACGVASTLGEADVAAPRGEIASIQAQGTHLVLEAAGLRSRLLSLSDRLLGPIPECDQTGNSMLRGGSQIGEVNDTLKDLQESLQGISQLVERLETL